MLGEWNGSFFFSLSRILKTTSRKKKRSNHHRGAVNSARADKSLGREKERGKKNARSDYSNDTSFLFSSFGSGVRQTDATDRELSSSSDTHLIDVGCAYL